MSLFVHTRTITNKLNEIVERLNNNIFLRLISPVDIRLTGISTGSSTLNKKDLIQLSILLLDIANLLEEEIEEEIE